MISERTFSRSFHGFWGELLPLLTPSFVHIFNDVYRDDLALERYEDNEETSSESVDSAFISEVAFYLAKLANEQALTVKSACGEVTLLTTATRMASMTVAAYEGNTNSLATNLGHEERGEVETLAISYDIFFTKRSDKGPRIFNPKIRGAGFIASCEADLAMGNTLYEIKTIKRNIASKDIRQILIYLALQSATGERRWTRAGFFNPRKATVHEFEIDSLVLRMSGGRPAGEVFREIVAFATAREVELDTEF